MATTFALLFVAELGDKTQLAVINMTCKQHQKPWAIFIGATAALATVTLLGVSGGEVITRFIPGPVLAKISAVLFVLLGILMWFGIL
jgi:putative Ca2+/H+ antiporter (TMEM165/GDT1 family)